MKDINALGLMAYDRFENFKQPELYYLNELEQVNNQVKHLEIELTAGVLAYEVLKNGNISNEKQQLIRATAVSLNDMN